MIRHWKYLKYVLRHKWFVLLEGLPLGVPLWLLVFHDWDKFIPRMWRAYADYFYGTEQPRDSRVVWHAKLHNVYLRTKEDNAAAFDSAWNAHQKRCRHHWQYWLLVEDERQNLSFAPKVLPMSDAYRREMLADWRGAGRAVGKPDTRAWYLRNRDQIILHPITRQWVEDQLGIEQPLPHGDTLPTFEAVGD